MGFFVYKFYTEKAKEIEKSEQLQTQVDSLNETTDELQEKINKVSETINSDNSSENNTSTNKVDNKTNGNISSTNSKTEEKDYTDIILDGKYVIPNSDGGWDFSKDGKAAFSGNTSIIQGTYETTGKNTVEIHYIKNKLWDDETGEEKISNIDLYEYITIDDNNNVYWTSQDGNKEKLERYGDAVKENFED